MALFSNKEIVEFYFTVYDDSQLPLIKYECRCGIKRSQKKGNGYTNLISHIRAEHSTYLNEIQEAKKNEDRRIQSKLPLVTNNAKNIFGWLDWIVSENREFSFCEKPLVHKYSCLNPITRPTLQKYSTLLTKKVEEKIVNALPEKFG